MNYERELAFVRDLAERAAAIALEYYKTNYEIKTKSDRSPVTIADELINEMVVQEVQRVFPEHGVLGEEKSSQSDRDDLWVCDPIDATDSFMMGNPTFMFSAALVKNGKPVVASTANPVSGDVFWAVSGHGAYMNGDRIRVSERSLQDSRLALPSNLETLVTSRGLFSALKAQVAQTGIITGSVFKGMLIAEGLCDGAVWPPPGSFKPWDVAAVKLIVEEAGGKFTNASNHEQRVDGQLTGGLVISNGVIHDELLEIIDDSVATI